MAPSRLLRVPAIRWVVRLVRPQPAPIPWATAIRAAVGIPVPVAIGLAIDQLPLGLLCAMGALCGTMTDQGGPYRQRAVRLSVVCVTGAAGFFLGTLAFGNTAATFALILVAGLVSGLLSGLGNNGSVAGLQFLVNATIASGLDFGTSQVWVAPAVFLLGSAWVLVLSLVAGIGRRHAPERAVVAAVYRALAELIRSTDDASAEPRRLALTSALNAAYDALGQVRVQASGSARGPRALFVQLNAAGPAVEAATALARAGRAVPPALADTADRIANVVVGRALGSSITVPSVEGDPELEPLANGLSLAARAFEKGDGGAPPPGAPRPRLRDRLVRFLDRARPGRVAWLAIARLIACLAAAQIVGIVLPIDRSYWLTLTVAVIMKPDFGSVFARSIQRALGTIVGVVIGSVLVVVLPLGPAVVVAMAALAFLMPITIRRNYGMFSTVLTPLVVLLLDLVHHNDQSLILARLIDTLLGSAIVVVIGYLIWPDTWRPRRRIGQLLANAADTVADYLDHAFRADGPERLLSRRRSYRRLSDLRASFQQSMTEPPPVSTRAAEWWPAIVALERVTDAITAAAVATRHGGVVPPQSDVDTLVSGMRETSSAIRVGRVPPRLTPPTSPALAEVESELEVAHSVLTGSGAGHIREIATT